MGAKNAFVVLATCDEYALSALCLAQSILNVGTEADLVILITSNVSEKLKAVLKTVFTRVEEVTALNSTNTEILDLIKRPDLGITITKINAWQLIDYEKCVFIDADCILLKQVDELFERPELSAVCDLGWPDCFNSGVFVFKPSLDTYHALINLAKTEDSFDGGDQGLLNVYFSDWLDSDIRKRLPFIYNMHSTSVYTYQPAFKKFGAQIKIVHFLGPIKPWMYNYNATTGQISSSFPDVHYHPHLQVWWDIFINQIKPKLPTDLEGIAGQLANLDTNEQQSNYNRKKQWEAGNIDYLGVDSFENIQKKLDESIEKI